MRNRYGSIIISISFLHVISPINRSLGFRYTVGNSVWSIPPSQEFYTNWSSSINFKIGDSLLFEFETGFYNVIQVSNREFDSCSAYNPFKVLTSGPVTVVLNQQGVFYYICNVSNYCDLGQKVSITVDSQVSVTPSSPSSAPIGLPEPSAGEGNWSQPPVQNPIDAASPPGSDKNPSESSVLAVRSVCWSFVHFFGSWILIQL